MNAFNTLFALLGRYPLQVALGILLAMPYGMHLAVQGQREESAAEKRLADVRQRLVEREQHQEQAKQYQKYADEVQQCVRAIEQNRLSRVQGWSGYAVDIKDKWVTADELRSLLVNASASERYYFKPKRLEITSMYARDGLPARIVKQMQSRMTGGAAESKEPLPAMGEKVLLSLSGQFLVFPSN